jgi:hypothetical protein
MPNRQPGGEVGRHATYFEPPDIIFMRLAGPVSEQEAMDINVYHRLWGQEHPRVFYLLDLSRLESIDPEGRKEASRTVRMLPLAGVAAFGAPIKARVLAKLVFTAMNLFKSKTADRFPIEFVDTEAEARAWIDKRRSELGPAGAHAAAAPSPA